MKPVRLRCCVPFCRHTRGQRKGDRYPIEEGMDWICATHWRLVQPVAKRLQKRATAAFDRLDEKHDAMQRLGHSLDIVSPTFYDELHKVAYRRELKLRQARRAWERCKRQAIERGTGI